MVWNVWVCLVWHSMEWYHLWYGSMVRTIVYLVWQKYMRHGLPQKLTMVQDTSSTFATCLAILLYILFNVLRKVLRAAHRHLHSLGDKRKHLSTIV